MKTLKIGKKEFIIVSKEERKKIEWLLCGMRASMTCEIHALEKDKIAHKDGYRNPFFENDANYRIDMLRREYDESEKIFKMFRES